MKNKFGFPVIIESFIEDEISPLFLTDSLPNLDINL